MMKIDHLTSQCSFYTKAVTPPNPPHKITKKQPKEVST